MTETIIWLRKFFPCTKWTNTVRKSVKNPWESETYFIWGVWNERWRSKTRKRNISRTRDSDVFLALAAYDHLALIVMHAWTILIQKFPLSSKNSRISIADKICNHIFDFFMFRLVSSMSMCKRVQEQNNVLEKRAEDLLKKKYVTNRNVCSFHSERESIMIKRPSHLIFAV